MNIKIIIKEIRRQSVWQIIGIYLVAGWGAFEAITSLTKTAGLPEWFPAASLALLILFLPVVIALSLMKENDQSEVARESVTKDLDQSPIKNLNVTIDKKINWKPAFISGAAIMIVISILGIIFLPNNQNINDASESGNTTKKDEFLANQASVSFVILPNEGNVKINYIKLTDDLEFNDVNITSSLEFKIISGEYLFIITQDGFNSLQFTKIINEDEINSFKFELLRKTAANENMLIVDQGFLASDDMGKIIPKFEIDRTEVSNIEYTKFVSSGSYQNSSLWNPSVIHESLSLVDKTNLPGPRNWSGSLYPEGTGNLPVSNISWYEADAYCRWQGKNLPTHEQWWRAAIGSDDYDYPWGNSTSNINKRANFDSQKAMEVEAFEFGSSQYGILNLAGNIAEWGNIEDPGDIVAINMGSSWQDPSYLFDINIKEKLPLNFSSANIGFRCVK